MKRFIAAILVSSALLLLGCATGYRANGIGGGYSETQLSENAWRVSFRGNGVTSPERAADMSLLRAAELAKTHGFTHFIIVDSRSYSDKSLLMMPSTTTTTGNFNTYGNANFYGNNMNYNANTRGTITSQTYGGQSFIISKPTSSNTIVCFKGNPQIYDMVYSADFLISSLSLKYGIEIQQDQLRPIPEAPAPEPEASKDTIYEARKALFKASEKRAVQNHPDFYEIIENYFGSAMDKNPAIKKAWADSSDPAEHAYQVGVKIKNGESVP